MLGNVEVYRMRAKRPSYRSSVRVGQTRSFDGWGSAKETFENRAWRREWRRRGWNRDNGRSGLASVE